MVRNCCSAPSYSLFRLDRVKDPLLSGAKQWAKWESEFCKEKTLQYKNQNEQEHL